MLVKLKSTVFKTCHMT